MTNKQAIPWARLAAESTAIILSILVAFSLDAWWDDRKRQADVQETIDNLIGEFDQSAGEFSRLLNGNNSIALVADTILNDLAVDESIPEVNLNDIAFILGTPTSNPQQGVLDAMISSGSLDLIQDANLRMALANWPAALANLQEEELISQAFVHQQLRPYLAKDINISSAFDLHVQLMETIFGTPAVERSNEAPELLPDRGKTPIANAGDVDHLIGLVRARKSLASYNAVNTSSIIERATSIRAALQQLKDTN